MTSKKPPSLNSATSSGLSTAISNSSDTLRPLTTLAAGAISGPATPTTTHGAFTPLRYKKTDKYKHIYAIHAKQQTSTLSHNAPVAPSFIGFRNLMVIVLIVGNLRLVIENYMKYGVLISLTGGEYRREDIRIGLLLFSFIPAHLFIGYLIELLAATRARDALRESKKMGKAGQDPKLRPMWTIIAAAHTVNATASLGIASYLVYNKIFHPLIGTMCEIHVVIVWLKQLSYAFTNRDLRDAYLSSAPVPDIYRTCPYPSNITIPNLIYFWWAPTLVYQPVYPRTPTFRPSFFFKRLTETILLSIAIWFLSQQYAVPTLRNSLDAVSALNLPIILQRLMKLSTISLVIWLIGFFALFHSFLNALSELLRFGDRDFYGPWWNSASLGTYWKLWNKPVYNFMRRHVYAPMQARGFSPAVSSMIVFTFSAVLHEVLVGIPTHSVTGVAFAGMMFQIPLIWCTMPLERMRGSGSVLGNVVFWVSFCLVGQPVAALLYYFSWQVKYGGVKA